MHIKDNLINFLYDKNYFIALYDNYAFCFNYKELLCLKKDVIILQMPNFKLTVDGDNLFITKMMQQELLIKGKIFKVSIQYE